MPTTAATLTASLPSGVTVTIARREGETSEEMGRRLAAEVRRLSVDEMAPRRATTFIDR